MPLLKKVQRALDAIARMREENEALKERVRRWKRKVEKDMVNRK